MVSLPVFNKTARIMESSSANSRPPHDGLCVAGSRYRATVGRHPSKPRPAHKAGLRPPSVSRRPGHIVGIRSAILRVAVRTTAAARWAAKAYRPPAGLPARYPTTLWVAADAVQALKFPALYGRAPGQASPFAWGLAFAMMQGGRPQHPDRT